MQELKTEIEIGASAAKVWNLLLDFPGHAGWNPFIRSIEGKAGAGERLQVRVQPEGGKPMSFKPQVLVAEPQKELRWLGRFLLPGLLDGEHFFQLEALGPQRTRFVHGERFSGLLLPLAWGSMEAPTRAGFVAMNQALKAKAEAEAA